MRRTRSVGRGLGAALGLVALVVFAVPASAVSHLAAGQVAADPPPEPIVGTEHPVAYAAQGTPRGGDDTAVTYGASVHLAAWRDLHGLRVNRVTREGTVFDPSGTSLPGGQFGMTPDIAFDGVNFLVVWIGGGGISAVRVSPDGRLLDSPAIVLSATAIDTRPRVAFDGSNYLVVWSTAWDIRGVRLSPDGTILGPGEIQIAQAGSNVALEFNGTHHLLVWEEYRDQAFDLRSTLVTTDGVALSPDGEPVSTAAGNQTQPVVTTTGTSFVVAWEDRRSDEASDIYGSRVSAAGAVLDPSGIPLAATPAPEAKPDVSSDGVNALVVWGGAGVRGARLDRFGRVLDPSGIAVSTLASDPAAGFDGDDYFVAGTASAPGQWAGPVGATRMTPGGAVLDPAGITISVAANAQTSPDTASDGTNTFVVWADDRHGRTTIYGGRVGPEGQILDGTGIPLSSDDASPSSGASVAFDGDEFLVVWSEGSDERFVKGARVDRSGVVLGRFDVSVGAPGDRLRTPKVAFGGGIFLVTWGWSRALGGDYTYDVRGARVGPDGEVLDPDGIVIIDDSSYWPVDVAFGESDFMIVSTGDQIMFGYDVYGTRVTTAGIVLDPVRFPISTGPAQRYLPQVAWQAPVYLVAWTLQDGQDNHIFGARVDATGAVLDPADVPISVGPGIAGPPAVAANGRFLVTWAFDRREGERDIVATRVDPDGTVAHSEGFAVATSLRGDWHPTPAVAAAPGEGNFSVAYQRYLPDQPYGTTRAYLRTVTPK